METIEDVLSVGIRVELWAWRSGLAFVYRQLDDKQRNTPGATPFQVNFLDDVFKDIHFTNYYSTRPGKYIDPGRAVVLLNFTSKWFATSEAGSIDGDRSGSASDNNNDNGDGDCDDAAALSRTATLTKAELERFESDVCIMMQAIGRLFYMKSEHGPGKTLADLVLTFEFPRVTDIEPTLQRVSREFRGLATVVSWVLYNDMCKKRKLPPSAVANIPNMTTTFHASLSSDTGEVEEKEDPSWTQVSRTNIDKIQRNIRTREEQCPLGVHCDKASNCIRKHTDHERRLFQEQPYQNFSKYKTVPCRDFPNCIRGRLCSYAHSDKEAWCITCKVNGHYRDGCKYVNQQGRDVRIRK